MAKNAERPVIDSLDFEVTNQELAGKSGSGWFSAIQLTLVGRCGWAFTYSYECTTQHVSCG